MGTTLELIQAYPLGTLEVEFTRTFFQEEVRTERRRVIGIYADGDASLDGERPPIMCVNELMPVLFAFPDLTTPLPDGTVPAVEIGKRLHPRSYKAEIVTNHDGRPGRTCVIQGPGTELSISEYGFNNGTLAAGLADLLREWHFAVLTAGKTLVEGIDFIRKER